MLEHLVGDDCRHAGHVAGFELLVESRRGALVAEVVELEGVVPCGAVERDLRPGPLEQRRPLLVRVARHGEHGDDQIDRVAAAPGASRPLGDRGKQPVVQVGHRVQRVDVYAVGNLAGHTAHPRGHRRYVDFDVAVVVAARRPCRGQERQLVVGTVVREFLLATKRAEACLHGSHVVVQARSGWIERHPVSPLDVRSDLTAQTEAEAATCVLGQLPGQAGRDHRTAGKRDRDPGRELEVRRRHGGGRDRHPGRLRRLGEQHPGESGCFDVGRELRRSGPRGGPGHEVESHRLILSGDAPTLDSMDVAWCSTTDGGLTLTLRVTPGGRRSEIIECSAARLRVRLNAPAVDDKANIELVRFLAEAFNVRRSAVTIVRGAHSREKTVTIAGPTAPPPSLFGNWFG